LSHSPTAQHVSSRLASRIVRQPRTPGASHRRILHRAHRDADTTAFLAWHGDYPPSLSHLAFPQPSASLSARCASISTPMSSTAHVNAEAGPSTPRVSVEPPETPTKSRRRSWFGLGGFGSGSGASSNPPRPRQEPGAEAGAEIELDDRPSVGPQRSTDANNQAKAGEGVSEVLTIDAQPVGSPRRSKRRSGPAQDEGEVMALSDLTLRRQSSRSTVRPSDPGLRASAEGERAEVSTHRATGPAVG
jgi:hypothetical protein